MDAITLLKDDHETAESLFKQFEKVGERAVKTKRQLADQMIKELTTHAYIEETLSVPRRARPRRTPLVPCWRASRNIT